MNGRERWVRCMHFQSVDYIPDEEFGYWDETFPIWHEQGLSKEISNNEMADRYFGFSPRSRVPLKSVGLIPCFEPKTIKETEKHQIIIDADGIKKKIFKDGTSTIPHYLDFPLKGRKEWKEIFEPRLDIKLAERYPENHQGWDKIKTQHNDPDWDKPVGIDIGSLFGRLRNWAGFEGISMLCYDDPELIAEMISHLTNLTCAVVKRSAQEIKIDYGAGWEDMCFRQGPIISPEMVRKFLTPNYSRITDMLRKTGCDIIYTDCDGNINKMIAPWLEGGVNGIFPVEVAAGSDPIAIRKKYDDKVVILGGVNKRALIAGKETIKSEIKRIKPYVLEGGWIPQVDHRCPPDVTFEDYLYYLDVKRETFGIPKPEEFESRPEIRKIKAKWRGKSLAV